MTDEPVEERVKSYKTDSPGQRFRTAQLRAELGAIENPEMSNEEIAVEWGTFPELVAEVRSRPDWDDYAAGIAKANDERRKLDEKERAAAFERVMNAFGPKRSLVDRVIARARRVVGSSGDE